MLFLGKHQSSLVDLDTQVKYEERGDDLQSTACYGSTIQQSVDGDYNVFTGCEDGCIRVFSLKTGTIWKSFSVFIFKTSSSFN